jgi:hypothetical protein
LVFAQSADDQNDEHLLRVELEHLARVDVDVDVDLTGFSTPEIDVILGSAANESDEGPPPPVVRNN